MRKSARHIPLLSSILLAATSAWAGLATDVIVSTDRSSASTSITSPPFATQSAKELLLAFVSTDAKSAGMTVAGISGGGLTWALVERTNVQLGTAEIWRAFAVTTLTGVTVTATLSQSVAASITVVSFTGSDATGTNGSGAIGHVGTGNAIKGAPTSTLTTTRANSWVWGVGDDWDNAIPRTPGPGQTIVHYYPASVGDTYWVQCQNSTTPLSGTSVTINDTAPTTDRYNLSIVEVLPALATGGTFSASGSITPAASGTGTVLTLTGAGSGTATADSNGNYTFNNLGNGAYTVAPSKSGIGFVPSTQSFTINGQNATIPPFSAAPTWTVSGTVSPANAVSGTVMTLSGAASATTTPNSSGVYSFAGLFNGTYTVTPTNTGFSFIPPNEPVNVNGSNVSSVNFIGQPAPLFPDLQDILPTGMMSVAQTSNGKQFQYTHDTLNDGPGPLVIQPVYNQASGNYQGTQYIYSLSSSGVWSVVQQIPIAGAFIFDSDHGHFHFPFTTYGLYKVAADGGIGSPVALSGKISFCINDSFIYEPSIPNAGAIGNLGSCSDPTSLRGLDIGAVDEYDQTDPGQSISLAGVPDGMYWLKALVDPDNFLAEKNKTNNETDVELTISGTTVQVLQTVTPTLNNPPNISMTAPTSGATISGIVQLSANTATTSGVQFLIDGENFGALVSTPPYNLAWDTTTVPNGMHWLAAQTTDPTGIIGTSAVVLVSVSNTGTGGLVVHLTSPATGSILSATTTLYATVASGLPVASVSFFVDSAIVGVPVTTAPYMTSWDTTTVKDGQHVISVSATDSEGDVGNSIPVTVIVDNSQPPLVIGKDAAVSVDGSGSLTTSAFSTPTASDLLVAFVSFDGPASSPQTANVSGAGLSWTLLERSNTQSGTAEIWSARADGTLSNVTVTALPGTGSGYHGSMTVIAFTNCAGTSVVGRSGAPSGPPDIILPGVIAGDWVFAVGNDWDNAIARVPSSGQVLVHQKLDKQVGDTYWVQSLASPTTANGLVDIHNTSPTTDQWNYAAVEIVAARPNAGQI